MGIKKTKTMQKKQGSYISIINHEGHRSTLGTDGAYLDVLGVIPHSSKIQPASNHDGILLVEHLMRFIQGSDNPCEVVNGTLLHELCELALSADKFKQVEHVSASAWAFKHNNPER